MRFQRVLVEEPADRRHQHLVAVFQHVMAGIVEGVHLGARQCAGEAGEEVPVEHEITHAPADERGPVCVAAVILNPDDPIEGVNDSKKLSEKRREALFDEIIARALCYQIVFISPQEIDERNILWATMDGMEQAVAGLAVTPDYVLVDGNRCPPNLAQPAEAVVKGDANSASIAAASILAKVSRDRYMLELDKQYPQYQLAKHKGYPTKLHYELIEQYGIQDFYRRSFLKKQGYWP